jgi:modification methylase
MSSKKLPLGQVLHGDGIELMGELPENSIDLIFADPPYNLQLSQDLWRPNMTRVDGVEDDWDRFAGFHHYDAFTREWLSACRRVLKEDGSLWVIGTYHNIHRVGAILQDLGFWILNEILWIKTNPMPNFRGVRFTNAHEVLIWASRSKGSKYAFHHHAMKSLNGDKQMRSDWYLPLCTGSERIKINGVKAHSTQKPEALLHRVLLSASDPDDIVLDPFFGTGTSGAVAKRLGRQWIGIEKESRYVDLARKRIDAIDADAIEPEVLDVSHKPPPRVPFGRLVESGLIRPGQELYFRKDRSQIARVKPDGRIRLNGFEGSIHQAGKHLMGGSPCNGWEHWYFKSEQGTLRPIDELRSIARRELALE